jgi:hypothetical protein
MVSFSFVGLCTLLRDATVTVPKTASRNGRRATTYVVPADLPPDQSRALATVMLRIHGHFRARHGRPPLPTAWTLGDHLDGIRARALLTDPAILGSGRGAVGTLVTRMRSVLWHALKPLFFRQSEINRDVLLALEALARDHEHTLHVHRALSARVAELEDTVARVRRRDG